MQGGILAGFANFPGFTERVTPENARENTANPGQSPTQPGCTDKFTFADTCSACAQGYTYVAATGSTPVCQCSEGYARDSTGACVFSGAGPAPPPLNPVEPGTGIPGLPGGYGGAPPPTDPASTASLAAQISALLSERLGALFGGGFAGRR